MNWIDTLVGSAVGSAGPLMFVDCRFGNRKRPWRGLLTRRGMPGFALHTRSLRGDLPIVGRLPGWG